MLRCAQWVRHAAQRAALRGASFATIGAAPQSEPQRPAPSRIPGVTDPAWKRLISLGRPEIRTMVGAVACLAVAQGTTMTIPAGFGMLIDMIQRSDTLQLGWYSGVALGVFVVGFGAHFGRDFLSTVVAQRIEARLRKDLFGAMLHREATFYDETKTGELVSRLSSDASVVGRVVTENVNRMIGSFVTVVGSGCMMLYYSPHLTASAVGALVPLLSFGGIYGRYQRKLSKQLQDNIAASSAFVEERLSNIRTVRFFVQEKREQVSYAGMAEDILNIGVKQGKVTALFQSGLMLGANLTALLVMYYGGHLVASGALTLGGLTSFFFYGAYSAGSAQRLARVWSETMRGLGASTRVFELLDASERAQAPGTGQQLASLVGHIQFDNVSFAYPTREHAQIFRGFTLDVAAGRITALVGKSGTGKSTLISLLARLYDPQAGAVLVDGVDIRELDIEWLRRNVGIVSQDPVLFAGTIAENIAYADPSASAADIERAARLANAHDFISSFRDGYATRVGERGGTLSGGQKQRIAIARAVLKDTRILILDEATSALDSESERLVQEAIDRAMLGRTVIVITHRVSTIEQNAHVAVLEAGRVVEQGQQYELLERTQGAFARLMRKQLLRSSGKPASSGTGVGGGDGGDGATGSGIAGAGLPRSVNAAGGTNTTTSVDISAASGSDAGVKDGKGAAGAA